MPANGDARRQGGNASRGRGLPGCLPFPDAAELTEGVMLFLLPGRIHQVLERGHGRGGQRDGDRRP